MNLGQFGPISGVVDMDWGHSGPISRDLGMDFSHFTRPLSGIMGMHLKHSGSRAYWRSTTSGSWSNLDHFVWPWIWVIQGLFTGIWAWIAIDSSMRMLGCHFDPVLANLDQMSFRFY